jgi:hypothetical protein
MQTSSRYLENCKIHSEVLMEHRERLLPLYLDKLKEENKEFYVMNYMHSYSSIVDICVFYGPERTGYLSG